jgi:hypothetical protein
MLVSATSPIYLCIKDGQTVLTDKPCDATTGSPRGDYGDGARCVVHPEEPAH